MEQIPEIKTITSLSGGKSSGYMWEHNPTDFCLFALVLTDDPRTAPKDPGLLREVQSRVPGFVGTTELELTLRNVLLLEERVGKPIDWVVAKEGQSSPSWISDPGDGWMPRNLTFDRTIKCKVGLPDKTKRWCTQELKVQAIFWHVYLHILDVPDEVVWMNIGYRADEGHRWAKLQQCRANTIRFPVLCPVGAKDAATKHRYARPVKPRTDKPGLLAKYRAELALWEGCPVPSGVMEYRVPDAPMVRAGVDQLDVMRYWAEQGVQWPFVSNCAMCFHHDDEELQHNYDTGGQGRAVIDWGMAKESERGARFDSDRTLKERLATQQGLLFPHKDFSCVCTD